MKIWALGSVVERRPDKTKVDGSIPSAPTEMEKKGYRVGRSQCPPPLRAPQSPVYIRKKDAD